MLYFFNMGNVMIDDVFFHSPCPGRARIIGKKNDRINSARHTGKGCC